MLELAVHSILSLIVRYRRALSNQAVVEGDQKRTWGILTMRVQTGRGKVVDAKQAYKLPITRQQVIKFVRLRKYIISREDICKKYRIWLVRLPLHDERNVWTTCITEMLVVQR